MALRYSESRNKKKESITMNRISRRSFVKLGALTALSTAAGAQDSSKSRKKKKITLGMASYTLRAFPREEALKMTQRVGLSYIAFKSFHLKMDATKEEIDLAVKQVKDHGLKLYGGGVIYMKDKQQVEQAFNYARLAGMKVIIGVPNHDLLDLVEEKVKQNDIKVAIHNHGPGDEVYPTPASVYEKVKTLDKRIGLCMDIGHTQRIGEDPVEDIKRFADRLHDLHIKDVDASTAEGKTVEIGRGVIDIPGVLRTLIDINYQGIASFEYEKDEKDPMPGLSESVGYVKGILRMMS
jgi:sugar phosphate isomerase/epimerase